LDVDGTTNLDVVDIDGAVDMASTLALASTLDMPDNAKILLGTGDDLEIYHDGSNSYITDSGTGDLIITATTFRPRTDHWIVANAANSENLLQAVADGAVTLYHNGLAKLATASGGVDVTGTVVTSGSITSQSGTNLNAILGATSPGPTGLQAQNDSGALIPVAINGSTFTAYTGSNTRLTIDASGNVGIGTTSPDAKLEAEGAVSGNLFRLSTSAGLACLIEDSSAHAQMYLYNIGGSAKIVLSTNGTSYFNGGGVGIGQTSVTEAFEVTQAATDKLAAKFTNSHGSSAYGFSVQFTGYAPDDNTKYFSKYVDTVATRAICYSDGDWVNADGTYGQISDESLKVDILAARSQWEDIKWLGANAINYRMKDGSRELLGWVLRAYTQRAWADSSWSVERVTRSFLDCVPALSTPRR